VRYIDSSSSPSGFLVLRCAAAFFIFVAMKPSRSSVAGRWRIGEPPP
jgi:hypothetical protein